MRIRSASTKDIPAISELIEPLAAKRILLGKELVMLYEAVQEFVVAEKDGIVVACGALHVFWDDLGEVRSLAVADNFKTRGIGGAILEFLETRARSLGLKRIFCLTFEVEFFSHHGYVEVKDWIVDPEVYVELVRSPDEGVAEFLNLARVKPNTLGNSRMLKELT